MDVPKFTRILEATAQLVGADKFAELVTEQAKKDHAIRHTLLPDPVKQPNKYMSDASLLRPELRIVGFDFRAAEFEDLCRWCSSENAFGWRLVHGDTGRGKSSLMVELCARHNSHATGNDWIAGFVKAERFRDDAEAFDLLFDTPKPLLIVLDYAERQSEIVTQLLRRSYQRAVQTPDRTTRIALIARRSTDVWDRIFRSDDVLQSLNRRRLDNFRLKPVTEAVPVEAVFAAAFDDILEIFQKVGRAPQYQFFHAGPQRRPP